jgi:hypothetical protein
MCFETKSVYHVHPTHEMERRENSVNNKHSELGAKGPWPE